MSETCLPPQNEVVEPSPAWRPIADVLAELTGETVGPRTAASWAAAGLPSMRGRRGVLLCTRVDLVRFLRERGPRLRTSA